MAYGVSWGIRLLQQRARKGLDQMPSAWSEEVEMGLS